MEDLTLRPVETSVEVQSIPQLLPDFTRITEFYDSEYFKDNLVYQGDDLGLTYGVEGIRLRFWAPVAKWVNLILYRHVDDVEPAFIYSMEKDIQGTYVYNIPALADGLYYLLEVENAGEISYTPGPYVTAVGLNGEKGYLMDLRTTDPEGFRETPPPMLADPVDAVIYEVHVRDMTMHEDSGVKARGKYLGFVEEGTVNHLGDSTGIDHLKDLGITHVQLLPVFDYNCLDESQHDVMYNWGYDPLNYNAPEGSYSSDASDPGRRILELKKLIMELHRNGLGVIMDVVYNHTSDNLDSNFHKSVPLYYHRSVDGVLTDASACGNETASERPMMRKFIIDSLVHWVKEYQMDGFRFDLMGIHDTETMIEIEKTLRKIRPDIILYGEGWTGGESPLPESRRLMKKNISEAPGIGAFNDDFRDGIKGHVFYNDEGGFVSGKGFSESVKFGIAGSVHHHEVNYDDIMYTTYPWAKLPSQTINYVAAHDNLTLYDKLKACNPQASHEELSDMSKLADAIVLTSQGVPFIHAGSEFLRTKYGDHNSYRSPDAINALNWRMKSENLQVVNYYKGLISLRKKYKGFRMTTSEDIRENLTFFGKEKRTPLHLDEANIVTYLLKDMEEDKAITFLVAFNGGSEDKSLTIPAGTWQVLVDKEKAGTEVLRSFEGSRVTLPARSALILKTDNQLIY